MIQLILIQIREQASVVIEDWAHRDRSHGFGIEHNAKVTVMAVRIENQRIQNAHSAEVITAAKLVKVIKNNGNVALLAKSGCGLGKPLLLRVEQPILTIELTPVEVQIVIHIVGAEFGGQLGRRELRQRFHLITAAADLIKENMVILPYPALGIIATRQDNDSEAVCIHLPFRGPCKISFPTSQS